LLALSLRLCALALLILPVLPLRLAPASFTLHGLLTLIPLALQKALFIVRILTLRLTLHEPLLILITLTLQRTLLILCVHRPVLTRVLLRLRILQRSRCIRRFIGFLGHLKIDLVSARGLILCIRHRADSVQQKKRHQGKPVQAHDDSSKISLIHELAVYEE
jgi:hypothetical protein